MPLSPRPWRRRRHRRRRFWTRSSRRSSSACRPTIRRASSAPRSPASAGPASSPTPASAAGTACATGGCLRCWGSSPTKSPPAGPRASSPRSASPPPAPPTATTARTTPATAASSSTGSRGPVAAAWLRRRRIRNTRSLSGTPSQTSTGPCRPSCCLSWCGAGTPPCSAPPPTATTSTASPATSSSPSSASTARRCSPMSTRRSPARGARGPPLSSQATFSTNLPGTLAQNALYFVFQSGNRMLKYDLATHKQSLIFLPNRPYARRLMTMEDGELGFAEVDSQFNLKLWSMAPGPEGDAGKWDVNRAIDLSAHLPAPALGATPCVVAFAEVVGVIFLKTTDGLYTFNLKTEQSIRVMANDFYDIIPYVSFYTPVLRVATAGEALGAGTSTA